MLKRLAIVLGLGFLVLTPIANANTLQPISQSSLGITCTDPINNWRGVYPTESITITFNEKITQGDPLKAITLTDSNGKVLESVNTINYNILTIKPVKSLYFNSRYTITIPATAVSDSYNNTLTQDYSLSFTTVK